MIFAFIHKHVRSRLSVNLLGSVFNPFGLVMHKLDQFLNNTSIVKHVTSQNHDFFFD